MNTIRNGVSPDAQQLRGRARPPTALLIASVGALALLAIFAATSYADDDPPITAADATPAASATSSTSVSTSTSSIVEAPVKTPTASEPAPPAASTSVASIDASKSPSKSSPAGADDSGLPTRPTFSRPVVPSIDNSAADAVLQSAVGTQEIPQAMPEETPLAMLPPNTVPSSSDLSRYMNDDPDLGSGLGSVRDFVAEGEESSPIGFQVRETRRKLKTGEEANGLLILKVDKDSAAARAGLLPYRRAGHNALEGLAIVGAMLFPPAILALPVIDYTEIGESYDMIIGIDGSRVSNFLDFEERMRNVQPGEVVYFSVVRNGKRIQIPVPVPALSTSASN